ncbi:LysM peptidoglycan-binding domain-containing protein [Photobacterium nomapromontoriensis]|uniref:LysM peptidoglycan-binding domain-containing protein n=1 Tax=Photobacterium nomapromontoriensis TaxID=2910237 RepID=UPI003D0A5220
MTHTYVVRQGDTLSELAVKFGTKLSVLYQLNAHQIKNIDLIYDGKTINIPDTPDVTSKVRDESPTLPNSELVQLECKVPKFVDSLYIPEHPKDFKQKVLMLTQEALDSVKKGSEICQKAVSGGTKEEIISGLNKLGVMDQFDSLAHEEFLKMKSTDDAKYYREALLIRKSLLVNTNPFSFPKDDENIGLIGVGRRIDKIETDFERKKTGIQGKEYIERKLYHGVIKISYQEELKNYENYRREEFQALKEDLISELDEVVEEFEEKAINIAKTIKPRENGKQFAFTDQGYYSSDRDVAIYGDLENLAEERISLNISDYLDSQQITTGSVIYDLKKGYEIYKHWQDKAHPIILNALSINYKSIYHLLNINNIQNASLFCEIYSLNNRCVVVKEQCLTENQLFNGWERVYQIVDMIDNLSPGIDELKGVIELLVKDVSFTSEIGYYPAYVLDLVLIKEVTVRINDFSKLIGTNKSYSKYVRLLLESSLELKRRCELLKDIADGNKNTPLTYYRKLDYEFSGEIITTEAMDNSLIWHESSWKPANLEGQIYGASDLNTLKIVECALASDPTKRLYILSSHPVLADENNSCVKSITLEIPSGGTGSGAGKPKFKVESEAKIGSIEFKGQSHEFIDDIPKDKFFPWHGYVLEDEIFGIPVKTEVTGGAQFSRFVYSAELLNGHHEMLTQDNFKLNAEAKAGFDLARGSTGVKKTASFPIDIPYRYRASKDSELITRTENLGDADLILEGRVHGFLAATIQLGTSFHVGNMDDGGLGVKGTMDEFTDSNELKTHTKTVRSSTNPDQMGAGVNVTASAFAGIEVGGDISCALDWKAPKATEKVNLFKSGFGARITIGPGWTGTFRCTYHDGKFIFIIDAGLTPLLGFGGKFANELNIHAADDFFSELLTIMQKPGFSRFDFFVDDESYAAVNRILTVAISFGISISSVLILPFKILEEMERKAMKKENAFFVADFINDLDNYELNKAWVEKMPAETLAKLLTVLVNYHDIPSLSFGINSIEEKQKKSFSDNNSQREAIIKIFEWLGGVNASDQQIRIFENAIQRMGLRNGDELNEEEKWHRYADNLLLIKNFFMKAKYEDYRLEDDDVMNEHIKNLNLQLENYSKYIKFLTRRMVLYTKVVGHDSVSRQYLQTEFLVIDATDYEGINSAVVDHYKKIKWDR